MDLKLNQNFVTTSYRNSIALFLIFLVSYFFPEKLELLV